MSRRYTPRPAKAQLKPINQNKKGNKKKYIITVLISILAIIGVIFGIFQYMNYTKEKDIHKRPFSKMTMDIAKQLGLIK